MISKNIIPALILALITFFLSLQLLEEYKGGDQVFYHLLYDVLADASMIDMPHHLNEIVSSKELLSGLIFWVGANLGVEKNTYISILNVILVNSVFFLLRAHKAPLVSIFLLLTNYYLVMLITAAERQKIAYILIVTALLISKEKRWMLIALAPFAHLVSFLYIVSILTQRFVIGTKNLFLHGVFKKIYILKLAGIFILGLMLIWFFQDMIEIKSKEYLERKNLYTGVFDITILLMIGLIITNNRLRMMSALFPLFIAVQLWGGSQVNIVAVCTLLYLLLIERRLNHPLAILLMVYFSLKSIYFVWNILEYGDGFATHFNFVDFLML